MTLWTMYQTHLKDYDLDTVAEITHCPKEQIEQLARDIWETTMPAARSPFTRAKASTTGSTPPRPTAQALLPMMLTGNIGRPGAGVHGWAGSYKAALFQGSAVTGPGFKGWVAEDPFQVTLDENAPARASTPTATRGTRSRPTGTTATARSSSKHPGRVAGSSPARPTCPRPPRRCSSPT